MTRTREWDLKSGEGQGGLTAMLSDTVGFVRELPHHLVASFRATLEEATHADLLLIVLDVSDRAADLHYQTVRDTLDELFDEVRTVEKKAREAAERSGADFKPYEPPPCVLLLNKADLLDDQREILIWQTKHPGAIAVCSLTDNEGRLRIGHEDLVSRVRRAVEGEPRMFSIEVPLRDAKTVHTLESRGRVIDRAYEADRVSLTIEIGPNIIDRLKKEGAAITVDGGRSDPADSDGWKPAPNR